MSDLKLIAREIGAVQGYLADADGVLQDLSAGSLSRGEVKKHADAGIDFVKQACDHLEKLQKELGDSNSDTSE